MPPPSYTVCRTGEVQGTADGSGGDSDGYDVQRMVSMDVPGGGMQTLPLNFNLSDDPGTVAREFMTTHGLPVINYEQVGHGTGRGLSLA